jgi:alpha-ketoglutarate-dependent taurine dioxygenase
MEARAQKVPGGEIECGYLSPGETLPLVVRPKRAGLDLARWAAENRGWIEAELRSHGGILFRDFDTGAEAGLESFARVFSPELMDYLDQHTPRTKLSGFVYTSTEYPADHFVPFHSENSKNSVWPMKIWFQCEQPAARGGNTPIADNRRVFRLLDPETRRLFMEKGVMYVRNFGEGAGLPWQTVFQTDDQQAVEARCRREGMRLTWKEGDRLRLSHVSQSVATHPATGEAVWFNQAHLFHLATLAPEVRESLLMLFDEADLPANAYFGDGTPIEDRMIEEINEAFKQASVSFPWQPRDVLMLENMLVAHGREPYAGARRILVAMAEPCADPAYAEPATPAR